jgi:hypothetical protein
MTRHDLAALRGLYAEVDAALEGWRCEGSADCCRFSLTGREPYLWPNEWALLSRAIAGRGIGAPRRALPIAGDCPLLGADGRCVAYGDRPFGCRTFYCRLAVGPTRRPPRAALAEVGRRIAALSEGVEPGAGPRKLTSLLLPARR